MATPLKPGVTEKKPHQRIFEHFGITRMHASSHYYHVHVSGLPKCSRFSLSPPRQNHHGSYQKSEFQRQNFWTRPQKLNNRVCITCVFPFTSFLFSNMCFFYVLTRFKVLLMFFTIRMCPWCRWIYKTNVLPSQSSCLNMIHTLHVFFYRAVSFLYVLV